MSKKKADKMKKAEQFYKDVVILNEHDLDIVVQFKRDVTRGTSFKDSSEAVDYYARRVSENFGVPALEKDIAKCFRGFYQNRWIKGEFHRYPVIYFKGRLGSKRYSRDVKIFKNSVIKKKLETAGLKRTGLVTFINIMNYVIWFQCYKED